MRRGDEMSTFLAAAEAERLAPDDSPAECLICMAPCDPTEDYCPRCAAARQRHAEPAKREVQLRQKHHKRATHYVRASARKLRRGAGVALLDHGGHLDGRAWARIMQEFRP